ncbi:MAG: heat shock protein HspQ [Rhodothalassiaceae bacterium]
MAKVPQARFAIGQVVQHRILGYRGLVFDVDPVYACDPGWYESLASDTAPKDRPWYHVLVDGTEHITYVAERHLELSGDVDEEIDNPLLEDFFLPQQSGGYTPRLSLN